MTRKEWYQLEEKELNDLSISELAKVFLSDGWWIEDQYFQWDIDEKNTFKYEGREFHFDVAENELFEYLRNEISNFKENYPEKSNKDWCDNMNNSLSEPTTFWEICETNIF